MVVFSSERKFFCLLQFLGNIIYCSDGVSLHLQDCIREDTTGWLGRTRCSGDAGHVWLSWSTADLTWIHNN